MIISILRFWGGRETKLSVQFSSCYGKLIRKWLFYTGGISFKIGISFASMIFLISQTRNLADNEVISSSRGTIDLAVWTRELTWCNRAPTCQPKSMLFPEFSDIFQVFPLNMTANQIKHLLTLFPGVVGTTYRKYIALIFSVPGKVSPTSQLLIK